MIQDKSVEEENKEYNDFKKNVFFEIKSEIIKYYDKNNIEYKDLDPVTMTEDYFSFIYKSISPKKTSC